jgi:hypothetical protein
VLADELSGRVEVRDALSRLVVEFSKAPDRVMRIGLPPGEYRIALAASEPAAKRGIAADSGEAKPPATPFDHTPKLGA